MIIVHVAEYASGGIATYLNNIISFQLGKKEVDKVVLINSKNNSEKFEFNSSKFVHYTFDYERKLTGIFKLLKLRKTIDSYNPDIVHFHSSFAGLVRATYIFKKADYGVVYCAHGWSFNQNNRNFFEKEIYSFIERMNSVKTNLIVNISDDEQNQAVKYGLPKEKMKVIYNSIPDKETEIKVDNPFSGKFKKLLFIGRFDQQKGLDLLLDNVDFESINIELVIIGASVLRNQRIQNTKYSNVKFLGWIDNKYINSYIKLCDSVIVPSRWEGFGLVALEAMKNKKMVIASDVGGLSELVLDNITGLKFNISSKIEIQNTVSHFSKMKNDQIKLLGQNGYRIFQNKYNNEKLCEELISSYKEVLS